MHLETFRTFCDVVETGSLSAAARVSRVTQSAVSQQLRTLEQRYGQRLIERAPRTQARPTEAGELLYRELKPLLAAFADLDAKLHARRNLLEGGVLEGSVRVATVYSVGLHTLPPVIKEFLRTHRAVKVRMEYRRTDLIYAACLSGELDFGIVALPARRAQLTSVPLFEDELVLALPPDHRLASQRRPSLKALDGELFVAFDRDIPTRRLIDKLLRQHHTSVQVAMELDNIETIKRSVEAGLGLSILPAPALQNEVRAGTLATRPLREGPFRRPIAAIHRRGRELSAPARALLEMLAKSGV
ncbi:MAG TPA: LysR family transcriptional regulator [Polyangiaceae bacterium]|nr:LysR family transcriptional regulator [Polyangiaceae bacterium]